MEVPHRPRIAIAILFSATISAQDTLISMTSTRAQHTAPLWNDGRVLIAGGELIARGTNLTRWCRLIGSEPSPDPSPFAARARRITICATGTSGSNLQGNPPARCGAFPGTVSQASQPRRQSRTRPQFPPNSRSGSMSPIMRKMVANTAYSPAILALQQRSRITVGFVRDRPRRLRPKSRSFPTPSP